MTFVKHSPRMVKSDKIHHQRYDYHVQNSQNIVKPDRIHRDGYDRSSRTRNGSETNNISPGALQSTSSRIIKFTVKPNRIRSIIITSSQIRKTQWNPNRFMKKAVIDFFQNHNMVKPKEIHRLFGTGAQFLLTIIQTFLNLSSHRPTRKRWRLTNHGQRRCT